MIPILGLFTIALIEIGLAGAVLARNPTRPVNRWFAAYTAVLAAWAVVNGTFRVIVDPPLTLIAARTAFAAAALIAVTVLRFADVFPQPGPPPHRLMQLATLAGLFMCGLAYSPWIVASVRLDATGSQPVYGPLHGVFALYFVTCYTWALIHLARKLRRAKGFARAQLQYLFLGTGLACLGGVTTNLLVPLVFGTSRFSVYGPYFTLLVVAFAAHSIVRHRLMDIRVVISRWTAYAVGWVLTAGVLVTAAVLLSEVMLGYNMAPAVDVLLGLAASVAFLFVAPVTRRLADRYLHRPAYDAAQLVREGSRLMGTLADPERVTAAMAELVGTQPAVAGGRDWTPARTNRGQGRGSVAIRVTGRGLHRDVRSARLHAGTAAVRTGVRAHSVRARAPVAGGRSRTGPGPLCGDRVVEPRKVIPSQLLPSVWAPHPAALGCTVIQLPTPLLAARRSREHWSTHESPPADR